MKHSSESFFLVETDKELMDLGDLLASKKSIAVDLEADSMFHFREKICLVQIGTEDAVYIVDPLVAHAFDSLKSVFENPRIQKVFHGADYDVRSLYRDYGIEIENLFDTEIACRFLGCRETGLESVIRSRFGIKLDKKFQKKDWSQRPLSKEMLEYAAMDVLYLIPLAEMFQQELGNLKRLEWVFEECSVLSRVRPQDNGRDPLFKRFKGAGRLDRRSLAVLEAILGFRASIAEKRDKPLFKVFGNECVFKIAVMKPDTQAELFSAGVLSPRQFDMYGEEIVRIIKSAMQVPDENLPAYPRGAREISIPGLPQRVKRLKMWRDEIAEKMMLDSPLLMTRAAISSIAVKMPKNYDELASVPEMKSWQTNFLGQKLLEFINELE